MTPKDNLAFVFNWQGRNATIISTSAAATRPAGNGINGNITWRHRLGTRSFETLTVNFNRNTTIGTPYFETGQDVATESRDSGHIAIAQQLRTADPQLHQLQFG